MKAKISSTVHQNLGKRNSTKRAFMLLFQAGIGLASVSQSSANISIYESYIILSGGPNAGNYYYEMKDAGNPNTPFASINSNLNLLNSPSLVLKGGQVKTTATSGDYQNANNVESLNWRFYRQGESPPSYATQNLSFVSNQPNYPNFLWEKSDLNTSLITGLDSGTFKMDAYFSGTGSYGAQSYFDHANDPSTGFYQATFNLFYGANGPGSQTSIFTGTGWFEKTGSGTYVMNQNNTYGGVTKIAAGTLQLGSGGTTGTAGTGAIQFSATGTLAIDRTDSPVIPNAIALQGTAGLQAGAAFVEVGTGKSATLSGAVTSASGQEFWKSGDGMLVLSNTSNNFGSSVVIQAGTLQVNSMSNLGGSGGLFIGQSGSGTFSYNGSGSESTGKLGASALQGGTSNTIEIVQAAGNLTVTSNIGQLMAGAALTKTGSGTLTLSGTNAYTGGTNVNTGTLVVNGSLAAGNVAVAEGAKLAGTGTIGGATTIHGKHAPGNGGVGDQTFGDNLTYSATSIFEWDLSTASISSGFDKVTGAAGKTFSSAGVFRVITDLDFSADTFWDSQNTWSSIFSGFGTSTGWSNLMAVSVYGSSGTLRDVSSHGSFSIQGTQLTWTAVPEPNSALAGLLVAAGLIRRRR